MMPFLGVGAANADITHKLSSSVQLTVNAAATQVERIGSTYSVSGNNVTTQYTPTGGSATSSIGSMTISSGVGAIPTLFIKTISQRFEDTSESLFKKNIYKSVF